VLDAIVPEFWMKLPNEVPPSPSPSSPTPTADVPFPAVVEEKGEHPVVVPPPNELPVPNAEVAVVVVVVVDDAAVMEPLSLWEVVLSSTFILIKGRPFPVSSSMIYHTMK